MKIEYEKHQRDYPLLGTALVLRAFCGEKVTDYFSYQCHPMYILKQDGVIFHFMRKQDKRGWAVSWLKKYDENKFREYRRKIDPQLTAFHALISSKHSDAAAALAKLHDSVKTWLIPTIVAVEVPPLLRKKSGVLYDLVQETRKKYESASRLFVEAEKRLLKKIERKNRLKPDTLEYLVEPELKIFLKTGHLPPRLEARKNFLFLDVSKKGCRFLSEGEAKKILKRLDPETDFKTTVLKGRVAYESGKIVKGKVKIIKLIKDGVSLKKGEILVTGMTDPRYLPAMKRAEAIVTDEGGVTCHAAIVARELKKPCVIGTKIATKVFKDGDMVEVDVNKGIVRKI